MADVSSARSRNRGLALAVALVALVTAGAVVTGQRTEDGVIAEPSSTTVDKPAVDATGTRPAETGFSWFDHGNEVEQFDFAMEDLACKNMDDNLTVDICAVADSSSGSFMVVGTESFWDPDETDADGLAWIPFNLTLFTMRRDSGVSRAVSVMDGFTEKAYTNLGAKVDLYVAEIAGEDVIVLVKRRADPDDDAYSYWESVQVIAASPTGAPTVVATYGGAGIEVASDGTALVISSLRYGPPTLDRVDGGWYSHITVTPSESDMSQWSEYVTSGPERPEGNGPLTLVGSYSFPKGSADAEPDKA